MDPGDPRRCGRYEHEHGKMQTGAHIEHVSRHWLPADEIHPKSGHRDHPCRSDPRQKAFKKTQRDNDKKVEGEERDALADGIVGRTDAKSGQESIDQEKSAFRSRKSRRVGIRTEKK